MASSSQHRCVFVGNIPYDATEEQLIDICREVGPVVSFRLVIDRETGKPKGYGFCEYKDEETALSARRNLQGYEINGRQLRVDFAENDKNSDRNREQGRGGPGLVANSDPQKQLGGPAVPGESAQHQPIGLHIAITAATVMAEVLGGPQIATLSNQTGLQGQSALASDPLTLHLAKMSRAQLNEIMSALKVMAQQNRDTARQLLLARPQLSKALFQAQIMLGLVTPQVLQMPNIRQPSSLSAVSLPQDTRQCQQPVVQNVPMVPPLARQGQVPVLSQNTLSQNQLPVASQPPLQPQTLVSRYTGNLPPQQVTFPGQSGVPPLPPAHPSIRPQIQVVNSSSSNQQMQPSLLQHVAHVGTSSSGRSSQIVFPNASVKSSLLPHLSMSDSASQTAPPISAGIPDAVSKVADRSAQRNNAYLNMHRSSVDDAREQSNRPSKLLKLDDGRSTFFPGSCSASNASVSEPSKAFTVNSMPTNPLTKPEVSPCVEKQSSQLQVPSDVESALLQQVLSLTPEQLSSLPPDQRQQVIHLQQALRRDQLQPS